MSQLRIADSNSGPREPVRVARNSVYGVTRLVIATALYFVLVPYMLRSLGSERYGAWALVGTLWTLVQLSDLGLSTTITKFVAAEAGTGNIAEINRVVSGAFILNVLIGVLIIVTFFGFRRIIVVHGFSVPSNLVHEVEFVVALAGLVFASRLVWRTLTALLDGLQRMDVTHSLVVLSTLIEALGTYLVLDLGYGLRGMIIKSGIVSVAIGICTYYVAKKYLPSLRPTYQSLRKVGLRDMLSYGLHIQAAHFLSFGVDPFDKLLLGSSLSVAYVSYYEVASRVSQQFRSLFLIGMSPILPAISELHASRRSSIEIRELYYRFTRYAILLALPLAIIGTVFAAPFVRLWLGEEYDLAISTVQILLGGWLLSVLATPAVQVLLALGKPNVVVHVQIITALVNILCSSVLVYSVGYSGVPLGTFIALAAGSGYAIYGLHRILTEKIRGFVRLFTPSVIAANLVLTVLAWSMIKVMPPDGWGSLLLLAAGCFLCYLLITVRLGCITDEDRQLVRELLRSHWWTERNA